MKISDDGSLPGEDIPAEPVHDGHQVEPAAVKPDVGDVGCPNLIRMCYGQSSKQIRIDRMIHTRFAQMRLRINSLQTHLPHQSLRMLPVDRIIVASQVSRHLPGTVEWRLSILLVDHAHEQQIVLIYHWFIVDAGSRNTQKLRLMADRYLSICLVNERNLIPMG